MTHSKGLALSVLALAMLAAPVQAELSAEHLRLMEEVASASQDCVDAEFAGPACVLADRLHAQATAAGLCWEAESEPRYCTTISTTAPEPGLPPDAAAVGVQFDRLPYADRRALQAALARTGHYTGAVDGIFGPATLTAILSALGSHDNRGTDTLDMAGPDAIASGLQRILRASRQPDRSAGKPMPQPGPFADYPFVGNWDCFSMTDHARVQVDLGLDRVSLPDMGLTVGYQRVGQIGGRDTAFHLQLVDGQEIALVEIAATDMVMIGQLGIHTCTARQ